ncbi:MAG: AAA family ATPase [Actinobacteria bacterium]|nr:AAA family ATPase [Actinomycetota bacterium]
MDAERKLATVLFADLVGSTSLAEQQDPERMRLLLERFYDAMTAEIERAGGTVEKFAGDAVMAAFGVPEAHEDHAERALHAALAMQDRLEELFEGELALRIGVNTGHVVAGRAREGSSFVTGDAVNVAARLEQAAAPGEIVVGARTAEVVRGAFELGEPFDVDAKGKAERVVAQRLVRALTLIRPRGIRTGARAFVGRDTEGDLLRATYRHTVEQREPYFVTLMGDAGVGKSTLVRELSRWLDDHAPQPLQRTGRCLAYGNVTYWALGEILREQFGIGENESPEEATARLGGRGILALALGLDVTGELHPLAVRDRLHEAWVELLTELAAEQPVVVFVEDLHWAEEPLLDLLERAARDVRGPLLVIATARPELLDRRPAWGGGRRNASLVWLDALSPAESEAMLDELVPERLPPDTRQALVERAEGNPFFLEELLSSLLEAGSLADELPDSVHAILSARVDRLGPADKAALQAASVVGRVFWSEPVRELAGGDNADWALLEDRDFVRRSPGSSPLGGTEYLFKHALTREVVYASVPKARRARLHADFATWLERTGGGRDEDAALLAHHYAQAANPADADLAWAGDEEKLELARARAVTWLRRAAELAIRRYDLDEAVAHLHRALELCDTGEQGELWRQIGRASALKFDGESFWVAMKRALALTEDPQTRSELLSDLAFQTAVRSGMWTQRPEHEEVEGWSREALELAEPGSAAQARALIARAYWNPSEERASALEGSAVAERAGDVLLRSYAWGARASTAFAEREYEESFDWALRRVDLAPEIADPDHITEIYEELVPPCALLGRFGEALRVVGTHAEVSSRLTPHHRIHSIAMELEVKELMGEWASIKELTPEVERRVAENLGTPCIRNSRSLLVEAVAHAYAGEDAEARRLEGRALEIAFEGFGFRLFGPRVRLALLRGELDVVEEMLSEDVARRGHDWMVTSAMVTSRLDALLALGWREAVEAEAAPLSSSRSVLRPFALRALALVREDEALLQEALERFESLGLTWHAEETRKKLAG